MYFLSTFLSANDFLDEMSLAFIHLFTTYIILHQKLFAWFARGLDANANPID